MDLDQMLESTSSPAFENEDDGSGSYHENHYESTSMNIQRALVIFAFLLVGVGVISNLIIIISARQLPLIRKKGITTGSRYYIINMSLADLCVLIVASVTNLAQLLHPWSLGEFMCKLLLPLRDVLILVSLVTITALSLERYLLITRPLQHQGNKSIAKFVLMCIWLACFLVNGIPLLLVTELTPVENGSLCQLNYPSKKLMTIHICFGIAIIMIPFIVVVYCYIAIGIRLKSVYKRRRQTMVPETDEGGGKNAVTLILRSKRLVKVLTILVIAFAVCNLPAVLYTLVHFFHTIKRFEHQEIVFTFFQCMMVYGSAINPLLLLLMASEYRLCITDMKKNLAKARGAFRVHFTKNQSDQQYCAILKHKNLPVTPL